MISTRVQLASLWQNCVRLMIIWTIPTLTFAQNSAFDYYQVESDRGSEKEVKQDGYVNPLLSDYKIENVQMGFSSIRDINVHAENGGSDELAIDHSMKVFGGKRKVRYSSQNQINYQFVQRHPTAAEFPFQPLYFEELNLERYGRKRRFLQPLASGVKFVGNVARLPYRMSSQPPRHYQFRNDHYPSGLPAPWVREAYPFSPKGLGNQGLAIAASILIIP